MKTAIKNCWILVLIVLAALAGLFLGHNAGKNAAENDLSEEIGQAYGFGPNFKTTSVIGMIKSLYVDPVDADSLEDAVIPMILKELDPHSVYIPRKEVEHVAADLKSDFGGIGVMFSLQDDTVSVISVVSGGPSSALGIMPGDKIIKVNGYDFTGSWLNNQAVLDSLRGEIGTKVNITILRDEDTKINYDIVRGEIPLTSVVSVYEIGTGVGYMKIDRFAEKTYNEMLDGIAKLKAQGCDKLIVDLRSNSGGFLHVVQAMCNEFLAKGQMIVYTEGCHQERAETRADGTGVCQDMSLVVLIDEYSASASEIFAGAMQDNDRATIIGRRSFGKGLVQSEIPLVDGSVVRLTVSRYHTPSGRCIQKPYKHNDDEYYQDVYKRYESGELLSADKMKADSALIFHTISGRTVFGGGGIIPDIFVPVDTAKASQYLYQLRAKRMTNTYAMKQAEKERPRLKDMKLPDLVHYLQSQSYIDGLMAYAAEHGLARPDKIDAKERDIIDNEVRALMAQTINDEGGIYPILNSEDPVISKALKSLGSKSLY